MIIKRKVSLLLLFICIATEMNAQTFEANGIYYKYTDNTKSELMVCSVPKDSAVYSGDIEIPPQIEITDTVSWEEPLTSLMTVRIIDKEAFKGSKIKSIKIPETIREIGSSAFSNCNNLAKAYYSTIQSLASTVFKDKSANPLSVAKHLYIGNAEEEVKELDIPNDVTEIGDYAFAGGESFTSVKIPSSVQIIKSQAFSGCSNLKKAIFASVDSLCRITFSDRQANPLNEAHHLFVGDKTQEETTIIIPNDVTIISKGAFAGCSEITRVKIHNNVTTIGDDAFYGCNNLNIVDYPSLEALTTISYGNEYSNPMRFCKLFLVEGNEMSSITINEDIKDNAFFGAKWLENVTIGNSVKLIGSSAFRDCSNLRQITIEQNYSQLETISKDAFNGCSRLEGIILPYSLKSIGKAAFRNCAQLSRIVIPANTTFRTGEDTEIFLGCIQLKEVEVNSGGTYIPESMFKGCSSLITVKLANNIQTIKDEAFSGCTSLKALPEGGTIKSIYSNAFSNCSGFEEITLPTSIITIGKRAFTNCKNLTKLFIPKEINNLTIGTEAFASNKLENIYSYPETAPKAKDATNPFGDNIGNINLFYNENGTGYNEKPWNEMNLRPFTKKRIIYFVDNDSIWCDSIQVGDKIIPLQEPTKDGWEFSHWVEDIPTIMPNYDLYIHGFFTTRKKIGELVYLIEPTKTITKVVADADTYKNLTNAIVPDSVVCEGKKYLVATIDDHAFEKCTSLQEISFSDSLLQIGKGAFIGCNQLTSIKLPKNITLIADSLFYDCSRLMNVKMDNVTSIGASAFNRCSSLNIDSLPSKLETIGNLAFCRSGLAFIFIPKKVSSMGNSVFLNCEQMDSVKFESGFPITTLPNNTFQNCTRLKSFTLSPSTTKIGANAFQSCSNISLLSFEKGVREIDNYAFSGCTELKDVTLPETIEYIGANAFYECKKITQITISNPTAPSAAASSFSNSTYNSAMLYVPNESNYIGKSPWNRFGNRILGITDNPLIYMVDGKLFGDTLMVRVGKPITPIAQPKKAGRAFSGWRNLPTVMPNDTVIVTGAFKYQLVYHNEENLEEYSDSLFFGEKLPDFSEELPQKLSRKGYRYEIIDTLLTMPANDTIINVRYYPTEANITYGGLTYHIYTEGDDPHAELIPGNPAYAGDIVVPDTITYMGEDNRYPVTAIRTDAFKNCINMTSVTLPETITSIGSQAFANCVKLTEITIPKSVETIGTELFLRCGTLKTVTFEDGEASKLETLPAYTFRSCSVLDEIDLPSSLTTIANQAFIGCSSLKEITIPLNVASIGEYAFLGCKKLEKITIASETTLPHASDNTFEDDTYDKATLYVSETVQAHMESPWINFENVELGGSTTAEKCATPKIYYNKGTLRFECDTPEAVIKSEITVSDAIKMDDANSQKLNKTYIIKASATAVGYKRSDVKEATIIWQDGKLADMEGFDGDVIHEEVEQQGVAGDMNGDGQVTAEDAALILKKLVGKEDNNNQGE